MAWGRNTATSPRKTPHLPRAPERLTPADGGASWGIGSRTSSKSIAHQEKAFGGGLPHVPTTVTDRDPPSYTVCTDPEGTGVDPRAEEEERDEVEARRATPCALFRAAQRIVCGKEEQGIRWAWGPVRGVPVAWAMVRGTGQGHGQSVLGSLRPASPSVVAAFPLAVLATRAGNMRGPTGGRDGWRKETPPSCMRERFPLLSFLSRLGTHLADGLESSGSIRTGGVAVCDSVSG
ncbi:hypothetical protein ZWY2020_052695 [Hordeum vulgare]|nr:hypothetical protein ZWY2020_052695 [Hordeum vulgare]